MYLIKVIASAVEGKAGKSGVGSSRSRSSLPLGRDKKGTDAEVALPYFETKGGVVTGDRDSFSQQCSKGAVDHIQVEERHYVDLRGESTMLGAFEKGRIGGKGRHVVHTFIKAGVRGQFYLTGREVVPQDVLPGLGIAEEDALRDMRGELGGAFAGRPDIHTTAEGTEETQIGWFAGADGKRGMIMAVVDNAVGQAEEMIEST